MAHEVFVNVAMATLLCCHLSLCSFCSRPEATWGGLVQLIVVTQHGAITPLSTFPSDIYQENYWKPWGGLGQLTHLGVLQQYQLGQFVRKCYDVDISHNKQHIIAYSSSVDRVLTAGQSFTAGLVVPSDLNETDAQVISFLNLLKPLHGIPEKYQPIESDHKTIQREVGYKFLKQNAKYHEILKELAEKTGLNSSSYEDLAFILPGVIKAERSAGLPIVDWLKNNATLLDFLEKMHDDIFGVYFSNSLPKRVLAYSSPLLNFIIKTMKHAKKTKRHPKVVLISGYDAYLAGILAGLGGFNGRVPPFSSAIFFELSANDDVSVFYRNSTYFDPFPVNVRNNCRTTCNFNNFLTSLQDTLVPVKTLKKPELTPEQQAEETEEMAAALVVGIGYGIFVSVIIIIGTILVYRKKLRDHHFSLTAPWSFQATAGYVQICVPCSDHNEGEDDLGIRALYEQVVVETTGGDDSSDEGGEASRIPLLSGSTTRRLYTVSI